MLGQIIPKSGISSKENLQWLFILRNLMLGGECLIIFISIYGLNIPLPQEPLWLVIAAIGTVNLYTWLRLQTDTPITELEIFSQLVLDVFAMACLLYLTGGATNPIIWIFLLPLILTSIILPHDYTWYMVILTTSIYTILIPFHAELPSIEPHLTHADVPNHLHAMSDEHYFTLHIFGMWIGFVFSAGLVAYFAVELANSIRERERKLAEAREISLRDESIVALGTLAASAAHDMGTPLGTMAIIIHEMTNDYPEHRFTDLHVKMRILQEQISRCKDALSVMSASAGELRAESGEIMTVVNYMDDIINQWRTQQPTMKLSLDIDSQLDNNAKIIADRTLTHSIINILNNAANATAKEKGIELHLKLHETIVNIKIRDFGPGISSEIINFIGKQPIQSQSQGLGVGLLLTYTTINRLGGKINIYNMATGGACIEIDLPLLPKEEEDA
jgi:two-component system sensor histidine kinase RegB